ncbi:DKNYY domain-containing protein [Mangrovivirga sp. M17]|uniref:DKNYY domain-containing protein n=1 Tax=Mangrovivirga halotolerans TaxID=2993936 RepID=A0ABT3RNC9_9BACT|nr:DKNYY domain-containing protein [Mangrovivirga halotolerans]MCX2743318.1 DKNYY domain-containing protein [Mangrovivirga halotolerans]
MRYLFIILIISNICIKIEAQDQKNNSSRLLDDINWKDQTICIANLNKVNLENDTLEFVPPYFYRDIKNNKEYYITCSEGYGPVLFTLKYDFDLHSFQDLGCFATDKDSVYSIFLTSDGQIFIPIKEADRATFETFGKSMYAKDKNHIYYSRSGIIPNADINTFKPIYFDFENSTPPLARDKSSLYVWDEILTDTLQINGLKEYLINTTN